MLESKSERRLRALRTLLLGQLIPGQFGGFPVSDALLERAADEPTLSAGLAVIQRQMPKPPRPKDPTRRSWKARLLAFLTKPFRFLFRR